VTHVNADTVDKLKREFENIAKEINPIMLQHRTHERTKQWSDLYYTHPNSNQATTVVKRIQALAKVDSHLAGLLMPIANRLMLKGADVMVAKDLALKNRNARKAAAQAKRDEKETIKKNPYHKLDPQVADILRQVAEPYRLAAVVMESNRLTNQLEEVKKLGAMFGSFDPNVMFPSKKDDHWHNQVVCQKRIDAQAFLDCEARTYHDRSWTLRANPEAVVKAKAERFAADMVAQFIHKVGTKLSGVVEKKAGTHTIKITGGSLQDYWMAFSFADGASFDVQAQVVWKTSVNGVHFPQFPVCFRNVKLANGTKMELPSEAKMKEAFV
jgi:hypothetical protein